jgi:hypothetical protein
MLYHGIIRAIPPGAVSLRVSIEAETVGEAWEQLIARYGAKNVEHVWTDYEESKRST